MTELTIDEEIERGQRELLIRKPLTCPTDIAQRRKTMSWGKWIKGIAYFFAFLVVYPKETITVLNQSV
jgi:hypothetical protein